PVGSTCVRLTSHVPVAVDARPTMASEQSGRVGTFCSEPKTLAWRRVPVYGLPSGFVVGLMGLPNRSTTAMAGVAVVASVGWMAFPLFQLSKYRKMPFRAHGVSTIGFGVVRPFTRAVSHSAKKNVLFFLIGPPKLPVSWCVFVQSGLVGFHAPVMGSTCRLL